MCVCVCVCVCMCVCTLTFTCCGYQGIQCDIPGYGKI